MAKQELQVVFTLNDKAFKRGVKNSEKQISTFQNSLKGLSGQLATVFGTRELLRFGQQASLLAGKVDGVKAAFDKLNGANLNNLRKSTSGAVSDIELMQNANLAAKLGLDVRALGDLFAFAAKTAQETGQSVQQLSNDIVRGIGRKSALILDNLGISALQLKEALGGVSLEAASVAQVTEAVAKIAAKSMGDAASVTETTEIKTARLNAAWQNLTNSFGQRSQGSYNILLNFLTKAVTKLDQLYKTSGQILAESAQGGSEGIVASIFGSTSDINERKELLKSAIKEQQDQLDIWNAELENASKNVDKWDRLKPWDTSDEKALDNAIEKTGYYSQVVDRLKDALDGLSEKTNESTGFTESQQKILDKVAESQKLWNAELDVFGTRDHAGQVNTLQGAIVSLVALGLDPANKEVQRLMTQLTQLESMVSKVPSAENGRSLTSLVSGAPSAPSGLQAPLNQMTEAEFKMSEMAKSAQAFDDVINSLGFSFEQMGMQFANTFSQMLADGSLTFRGLAKEITAMISQMAIALAIQTALKALMGDATAPAKTIATLAIIGGATAALSASIPQLASGGVATSPTLAMIGEGRESEAVLPLSKLEYMMNNSGGMADGQVVGVLRGSDILLQYQRANKIQRRSGSINYGG